MRPAAPDSAQPPADPARQGARYWHYTVNELGIQDIEAQIDRIHAVKIAELGAGGRAGLVSGPLASGFLPVPSMNAATLEAALGCACEKCCGSGCSVAL